MSGSIVQASSDLVPADPDDPQLRGPFYTPVGGLWVDPNAPVVPTCTGSPVSVPSMLPGGVIVVVPSC